MFSVRDDVDNLVFNEKGFTMYSRFSLNEASSNDKEIEFLLKIKSMTSDPIDLSNYLITKIFIKMNSNANHVFEFLQNPLKSKIFNA